MADGLDVYRDWLKIADEKRPLTYYQLLKLPAFEDDSEKIRKHYRQLNQHIRQFASGKHAKESQALLNELAKAMLCLTDARRKQEYDAGLGRKSAAASTGKLNLAEMLLQRKLATPEQLKKAENFAKAVGVEFRDALLQQKIVAADVLIPMYASVIGLPYVDLDDLQLDPELLASMSPNAARQHSCTPILVDDGQVLVASPNPLNPDLEEQLRMKWGMPVRSVICSPAAIHRVVEQHFTKEKAQAELSGAFAKKAAVEAPTGDPVADAARKAEARAGSKRNTYALLGFCMGTAGFILGCQAYFPVIQSTTNLYIGGLGIGGLLGGGAYVLSILNDW